MNTSSFRLKPHQKAAIGKIKNGSIVCGGTGTGKSITALAYYYFYVCHVLEWSDGSYGPVSDPIDLYIITTARKRDTKEWEAECERFDFSNIKVTIDSWNNMHKYTEVNGAFFIFDEQRVVGNGQWTKSFYKITKRNRWILLSATPGDTWMDYIPVFVANGFYKNRSEFLRCHAVYSPYVTKFPKIDRWVDTGHLEKLRRSIVVNMNYQKGTKRHVENIVVPYDKANYDIIAKKRWNPWEGKPIEDISGCCQLLRRASSSVRMVGMANYNKFDVDLRASKIYWLCCDKHPKLIVFYNYDYELEAMKETFSCYQNSIKLYSGMRPITVAEWNGHKHETIPDTERWIYLVQYFAGAEGWNCIDTNAMAFYSQSYSYKIMEQAMGRIDRINTQFEDLHYYILKSESPIDKAVDKALSEKKTFNEKLFFSEIV
ncbi:DEAD/DEAH box helicase family protein [Pseudobutyrivibrio sp.]